MQPKTGELNLQAAGKLQHSRLLCTSTAICWARNSCEQVPARYTSMRPSAIQTETAWASCEEAPDKLQGRGCKKGNTTHGASSTRAAPGA